MEMMINGGYLALVTDALIPVRRITGQTQQSPAPSSSQATETFNALARVVTSISVTGRRPLSTLDKPDWSICMPNTCKRAASSI